MTTKITLELSLAGRNKWTPPAVKKPLSATAIITWAPRTKAKESIYLCISNLPILLGPNANAR